MAWRFNDLVVEGRDAEAGTLHANCREMKIDFLRQPHKKLPPKLKDLQGK